MNWPVSLKSLPEKKLTWESKCFLGNSSWIYFPEGFHSFSGRMKHSCQDQCFLPCVFQQVNTKKGRKQPWWQQDLCESTVKNEVRSSKSAKGAYYMYNSHTIQLLHIKS